MATCAIERVGFPVAMEATPCRAGLCRRHHRNRCEGPSAASPDMRKPRACRGPPTRLLAFFAAMGMVSRTQDDAFGRLGRIDGSRLLPGIVDALFFVRLDALRHFIAACKHRLEPVANAGRADVGSLLREVQCVVFYCWSHFRTEYPLDHGREKARYRRHCDLFGSIHAR